MGPMQGSNAGEIPQERISNVGGAPSAARSSDPGVQEAKKHYSERLGHDVTVVRGRIGTTSMQDVRFIVIPSRVVSERLPSQAAQRSSSERAEKPKIFAGGKVAHYKSPGKTEESSNMTGIMRAAGETAQGFGKGLLGLVKKIIDSGPVKALLKLVQEFKQNPIGTLRDIKESGLGRLTAAKNLLQSLHHEVSGKRALGEKNALEEKTAFEKRNAFIEKAATKAGLLLELNNIDQQLSSRKVELPKNNREKLELFLDVKVMGKSVVYKDVEDYWLALKNPDDSIAFFNLSRATPEELDHVLKATFMGQIVANPEEFRKKV